MATVGWHASIRPVGEIHDRLMDDNGLDLAHAFNQACAEIAELYLHIDRMAKGTSSGFMRNKLDDAG